MIFCLELPNVLAASLFPGSLFSSRRNLPPVVRDGGRDVSPWERAEVGVLSLIQYCIICALYNNAGININMMCDFAGLLRFSPVFCRT